MDDDSALSSTFEADGTLSMLDATAATREFSRIWQGFMTARFTLGLLLLVLQLALYATGISHTKWLAVICLAYVASTIGTGLFGTPRLLDNTFNWPWIRLVGIDVLAFFGLQMLQGSNINYTPLFALPVLLTSVMGSLQLAMGTAASVTMLLLGTTSWSYAGHDPTASLVQAALSGLAYFAMAVLGNQMSSRLASAGLLARRNQAAARVQMQVNSLVIETLPDGVLIVDDSGKVRAANPAAVELLLPIGAPSAELHNLSAVGAWAPLLQLTRLSLATNQLQESDLNIRHPGQGPRRVRARARPTNVQEAGGEKLCVLFLQDQRELEARIRTEKLASMGRLSTAVAHEIRNPLAAITQANALLEEDLTDPHQQRLTRMVSDNAQRLARIVDDILNASRVQPQDGAMPTTSIDLNSGTEQISTSWGQQNQCQQRLLTHLAAGPMPVQFDADHLHRVLINLLDNARRFASDKPQAIQVGTERSHQDLVRLYVWSDGPPMDQTVERHLFEPFFSSASRSSGLGLHICRELCQRHGASITYLRRARLQAGQMTEGNEFQISFEVGGRSSL